LELRTTNGIYPVRGEHEAMADDELPEVSSPATSLIVTEPQYFFAAQKKTLEARVAETAIPADRIDEIRASKAGKVVRE
jgi:hypothetical protein